MVATSAGTPEQQARSQSDAALAQAGWNADCTAGRFAKMAPGVGIVHLTGERMVEWPIPVPPVPEQVRIVAEVARLESVSSATMTALTTQQRRLARLRQAILRWAFEGKLVDQDPNDEPATVLLAHIRGEVAAAGGRTKQRRKSLEDHDNPGHAGLVQKVLP